VHAELSSGSYCVDNEGPARLGSVNETTISCGDEVIETVVQIEPQEPDRQITTSLTLTLTDVNNVPEIEIPTDALTPEEFEETVFGSLYSDYDETPEPIRAPKVRTDDTTTTEDRDPAPTGGLLNARARANNATIRTNLSTSRSQAEIYYDYGGSYEGVCEAGSSFYSASNDRAGIKDLFEAAKAVRDLKGGCNDGASYWVMAVQQVPTAGDAVWCVDSTGTVVEKRAKIGGSGADSPEYTLEQELEILREIDSGDSTLAVAEQQEILRALDGQSNNFTAQTTSCSELGDL